MTATEMQGLIAEIVARIIRDRGGDPPPINGETALLSGDIPFDSLDLAALVVELEIRTGKDPFRSGFIDFRRVDELAALYCD
jgi:acyl carrier protein